MKKSILIIFTLLLTNLSVYTQTDFSKSVFSIAGLDSAETLSVKISSIGCFHHIVFNMEFTKGDTGILVSMVEMDTLKKQIGCKQISIAQAAVIDGYVQYLRKLPVYHATCTTMDTINLVWLQLHKENYIETFFEGTCFSDLYPYTFWNIYYDFRQCCIDKKRTIKKCNKGGIHCNYKSLKE